MTSLRPERTSQSTMQAAAPRRRTLLTIATTAMEVLLPVDDYGRSRGQGKPLKIDTKDHRRIIHRRDG
jgi:hypothetical protein